MDDVENEVKPLLFSKNKTPDSSPVDVLMKFADKPGWQFASYYYAQAVVKILDEIIPVLTRSSDHLTIGINSDGVIIKPRHVPMVYFTGLLISNFHPEASEVDETFEKLGELLSGFENETIKLLKTLKKTSAGIESFTKPLIKEMNHPNYKAFSPDERDENKGDSLEHPTFKKNQFQDTPGVWLELINSEKEALYLRCQEIMRNDRLIRIPAKDLSQEKLVKLVSLMLAQILQTVQKANSDLTEIQLTPLRLKEWKSTSAECVHSLKLIRKARNFSGDNCAPELKDTLIEMTSKLNIVISNRIRDLRNHTISILRGIQCIRMRTGNWAPDQIVVTSSAVTKYISPPRPAISKLIGCFQAKSDDDPADFVKMFSDIGNEIGESFVLEVAISEDMKDLLFEGSLSVPGESCVCLTLPKVETVALDESQEQIVVDFKKSDTNIGGNDEDVVIAKMSSPQFVSSDQSPVSETIFQSDSSRVVLVESLTTSDERDSVELPAIVAVENMITVDPGFEDDAVSTSNNPFQSSSSLFSENPGKLTSEENPDDNTSFSKVSPSEGESNKTRKTNQGKAKPRVPHFTPDF